MGQTMMHGLRLHFFVSFIFFFISSSSELCVRHSQSSELCCRHSWSIAPPARHSCCLSSSRPPPALPLPPPLPLIPLKASSRALGAPPSLHSQIPAPFPQIPSLWLSCTPLLPSMAQESWNCDAEGTDCQQPEGLVLCTNNCGFFGSPATMNLCSKCYREVVLKPGSGFSPPMSHGEKSMIPSLGDKSLVNMVQGDLAPAAPILSVLPSPSSSPLRNKEPLSMATVTCSSSAQISLQQGDVSTAVSVSAATLPTEQIHRQTVNRCHCCSKRVGLLGFKCRCGDVFCSLHRYSDKHNCTFDYKAAGRDAIAKANPVVKADKIGKI